jgi:hypothetical protein
MGNKFHEDICKFSKYGSVLTGSNTEDHFQRERETERERERERDRERERESIYSSARAEPNATFTREFQLRGLLHSSVRWSVSCSDPFLWKL